MYLSEFRQNWLPLAAAGVGMALGVSFGFFTLSLFGPPLLAEFGWSRADFALIGALPLSFFFLTPIAGRFADRVGVRTAVAVGFTSLSLGFLAFTIMNGDIRVFFAIWIAQNAFAMLTSSFVYCRVVVERFDASRGIALAVLTSAPPLAGAIGVPLIGEVIDSNGWRAGYLVLAGISAMGGALSIAFVGRGKPKAAPGTAQRLTWRDLSALLRHPVLLLSVGGMFLVNIPQLVAASQLKLVVMDGGVSNETATWMVSLYAAGVLVGRFLTGLALDRIKPHMVAFVMLSLPTFGYCVLAAQVTEVSILAFSVALIGFAQGAEGDVGAYIISRRFDLGNFSMLVGLLSAMIGLGGALGSLALSFTLRLTDSYAPFLIIAAVGTIAGATLFGMTGRGGEQSRMTAA
jgi:predicted MFS family arabinose efflux permease